MKQLKNKQIIGIDNGYGNLKTASRSKCNGNSIK